MLCRYRSWLVWDYATSSNTENHISVWLYLCKGEYGETLEWPFCADIEIELLNWREDSHHHKHLIHFSEAAKVDVCGRVMRTERASRGKSTRTFLPTLSSLTTQVTTQYSSPFDTWLQGYKMQLKVDANTENHISIWLYYLCKGEYDETLEWPLCADIEIELFNWR